MQESPYFDIDKRMELTRAKRQNHLDKQQSPPPVTGDWTDDSQEHWLYYLNLQMAPAGGSWSVYQQFKSHCHISLPCCVSTNVFSQPLSTLRGGDCYNFHPRQPATTHVERDSRDQRSMAMQWPNISKEIDSLLKEIQAEIHVTLSPEEAKKSVDLLFEKWDRLEGLHGRYLTVIN